VNCGQELVIGGYTPGPHGIDAIIVGYHGDGGLTYVARIRSGFVPASRRKVFEKLRPLVRVECPFVNLRAVFRCGDNHGMESIHNRSHVEALRAHRAECALLAFSHDSADIGKNCARDDKNPRSVIKEEVG
jgi:hypothetical protein